MRRRQVPVALVLGLFAVQIAAMVAPSELAGVYLISDITPFLVPIATGTACLVVAKQSTESRPLWTLLGLGCIAWALGDIGFSIYSWLDIDPSGRLSYADAGYLLLIPLWAAALIAHPSRSTRGIDRFGTTVDALTILAVAGTLTAAYVLAPSLLEADNFAGAIVNAAYPVGDLLLLVVLVSMRTRASDRLQTADLLVAGAAAAFAVGDIVYAWLITVDRYVVGHPVDLTWSISFVLVALAAGRTLASRNGQDEARTVVPVLAIFGLCGMALLSTIAIVTRLENTIVLGGAVVTAILLIARLVLLLFDRSRILDMYAEKVEELREAEASRQRFIATVSHDLRAPLASISGFAELLREPEILRDATQVAEMTSSIERNARRLARLTEDLLCAGQFATGHPPPLRLAAVDLRQVAEEAINDMGRADRVSVQGSRWIYAMADKQRIQQILVNLVENAFKHSGSPDVTIGVYMHADGPTVEVADHGVGIPGERIAQIFDPFVSDYGAPSSVGLGLYVVRNLVAALGGRISVTSEVDAGTTFKILLPPAVPESAVVSVPASVD